MTHTEKTFFLHHYEQSPYAEKIRSMFGLAGYRWGSVLSPPYPPRPNVDPLAGGYRRIPVAQCGADVFCDTSLIAEEVAGVTDHPELAPRIPDSTAAALAGRAEGDVFFAAITSVPPLKLLGGLLLRNGPLSTVKFVRDRAGMMKGASVRPPRGQAAARLFDEFLAAMDSHLADRESMEGDQLGYADFCVYHPIWLAMSVGGAKSLRNYGNLRRWLAVMEQLGHGERTEMTAEDAFAEAAAFEPRDLPADAAAHEAVGEAVTIAPADYGKVGVAGTLVAAAADRYILRRETERFGAVHVHFPAAGYDVIR